MKKNERLITCIVCPKGCDLTLRQNDMGGWMVTGNECEKGPEYALEEVLNPQRVLTTTVAVAGGNLPLLPVRSAGALPMERLFDCMNLLSGVNQKSPVVMGSIVVENILGLGVDIIATRTVYAKS